MSKIDELPFITKRGRDVELYDIWDSSRNDIPIVTARTQERAIARYREYKGYKGAIKFEQQSLFEKEPSP